MRFSCHSYNYKIYNFPTVFSLQNWTNFIRKFFILFNSKICWNRNENKENKCMDGYHNVQLLMVVCILRLRLRFRLVDWLTVWFIWDCTKFIIFSTCSSTLCTYIGYVLISMLCCYAAVKTIKFCFRALIKILTF